jgi:hypothetical protein
MKTATTYLPYSEEWEKEISKMPKSAIIKMASSIGKDKEKFKDALHDIKNISEPRTDTESYICIDTAKTIAKNALTT